jgi:hypothetical protein
LVLSACASDDADQPIGECELPAQIVVTTADGAATIASVKVESGLCGAWTCTPTAVDGGTQGCSSVYVQPSGSCELTITSIHGQTAHVSITGREEPNIPPLRCRSGPMVYEVPYVAYTTSGNPLRFPTPDGAQP